MYMLLGVLVDVTLGHPAGRLALSLISGSYMGRAFQMSVEKIENHQLLWLLEYVEQAVAR